MSEDGAAGYWSVKDVVAHLTAVGRWFANALRAHLLGQLPPNPEEQLMELEERNRRHFEQNRERTIRDVLNESQEVFAELVELVETQSEEFLFEPQNFERLPAPVTLGKVLKEACAEHYRHHIPSVREWLSKQSDHC